MKSIFNFDLFGGYGKGAPPEAELTSNVLSREETMEWDMEKPN